jgi:hypothetical protein
MAVIFSKRHLSQTFLNRNVVILSEAHRNRLGDLRFSTEFDFGKHGKWLNRIDIPHTQDIVHFTKQLDRYRDELYEQIGVLEEIERWAGMCDRMPAFNHVLYQDKPMFFHARVAKETLILQIFGEGLYDFEIRWDFNRAGEHNSFKQKLGELAKCFADHLRDIDGISMNELVKGVAA